jgi:hypothetical protein
MKPMRRELSHEEAFAALDAAALDALDPGERDAVFAHVEDCAICRSELASLRATVAQLALAVPTTSGATTAATRERIRNRLVARAGADVTSRPSSATPESREAMATEAHADRSRVIKMLAWRRAEWLAIAASVALIFGVSVMAALLRQRQLLKETVLNANAAGDNWKRTTDSLRSLVISRDSMIAGITGRDVAVVQLTSSAAREPKAMMFWDRDRNGWTFIAHNLPMPQPGRVYQLWLVTPTSKISAGTFMPDKGEAMVRATYPIARDGLVAVAVTDEPAGGMPQPTGQMVVAGNATR